MGGLGNPLQVSGRLWVFQEETGGSYKPTDPGCARPLRPRAVMQLPRAFGKLTHLLLADPQSSLQPLISFPSFLMTLLRLWVRSSTGIPPTASAPVVLSILLLPLAYNTSEINFQYKKNEYYTIKISIQKAGAAMRHGLA